MTEGTKEQLQKYFPYLLLAGILLNASGLFTAIPEPDGSLYATIAKHMAVSGDWINLFGYGHDWLDKPHFPFWITAFSFKILGINSFAYKLPAFLFWLLGLRFTFLLAKELYNKSVAQLTVLVYTIALHTVIANFDVRAEPYLTTLTIGAIYYMYRVYCTKKITYVIICALLVACAVMTKGIFVLITIAGGMVIYFIVTAQWKEFLNYRWWLLIVLVLLFITPELYCLYQQFDLHPDKIVFGQTNVSGIKFFFWDSQFGRFLNTGPIKGKGDYSFFFHTTLWAFLPWSIIFYVGVIRLLKKGNNIEEAAIPNAPVRVSRNRMDRWIIFGSAAITFILFSLSRFQLPHYIIIIFPQFAMITANYLWLVKKEATLKRIYYCQFALLILAAIAIVSLSFYAELSYKIPLLILVIIAVGAAIFFMKKSNLINIIFLSFVFATIVYLFLNLVFYPQILPYQGGAAAATWLQQNNVAGTLNMYHCEDKHSFEFYANRPVNRLENEEQVLIASKNQPALIFTNISLVDSLRRRGLHLDILKEFDHYHISKMSMKFLNPSTRDQQLEKLCIAKLYAQ